MVNATDFDGLNDWFSRGAALDGVIDGQLGLFSGWLSPANNGNVRMFSGNAGRIIIGDNSGTGPGVTFRNASNTVILDAYADDSLSLDIFQHVLMAWSTSSSLIFDIYIGDLPAAHTEFTQIEGTIDYTGFNWGLGASGSGSSKFNGCMSEIYINLSETLDITVEDNRRKFIDGLGQRVDLGEDGSLPTGSAPDLYFPNPFDSFGTNAGTAGDFVEDPGSSVIACANTPPAPLTTGGVRKPFVLPNGRRYADEGEARLEMERLLREEAAIQAKLEAQRREDERLRAIEAAKPRLPNKKWRAKPKLPLTPPPPPPPKSSRSLMKPPGWPSLFEKD